MAGSVLTQAVESVAAIDVCAFTHSELRYGLQNNGILTSINITFAVSGDLEAGTCLPYANLSPTRQYSRVVLYRLFHFCPLQ